MRSATVKSLMYGSVAAAVLSISGTANATILSGDSVDINLTADSDFGTQTILVGAGVDGNYFGNQFFDFDAGVSGDLFTIESSSVFSSIDGASGIVTWTLTGLDFGTPLVGFNVIQNDVATTTIDSLTATSVTFSYDDLSIPQGVYFTAEFITDGTTTTVPVPGMFAIFGIGLAGLVIARRRREAA